MGISPLVDLVEWIYRIFFTRRCPKCEKRIKKSDEACPHCGARIKTPNEDKAEIQSPNTDEVGPIPLIENVGYIIKWAFFSLISTVVGIVVIGVILELTVDAIANSNGKHGGASLIIFFAVYLVITGYPVIGSVVGAIAGAIGVAKNKPVGNIRIFGYSTLIGMIISAVIYILVFVFKPF